MALFKRNPSPKLTITPEDKSFVDTHYQWLIQHFGQASKWPVILPSKLKVPETSDRKALGRMLVKFGYDRMGIDAEKLDLEFFYEGNSEIHPYAAVKFDDGTPPLGEYQHLDQGDGNPKIMVNLESLKNLDLGMNAIAVQLSAAKLRDELKASGKEESGEYISELAAVFFGFGLFQANSAYLQETWQSGEEYGWAINKYGKLPIEMTAYALSVHAWLRDEHDPDWVSELVREPRRMVEDSLAYLFKTHDCPIVRELSN